MAVLDNFAVTIPDYYGNSVTTNMFQLLQWIHALRLEQRTGMRLAQGRGRKTSTIIGGFLNCPKRYPAADLLDHLEKCKADIDAQLERMAAEKQEADA